MAAECTLLVRPGHNGWVVGDAGVAGKATAAGAAASSGIAARKLCTRPFDRIKHRRINNSEPLRVSRKEFEFGVPIGCRPVSSPQEHGRPALFARVGERR